MTLEKLDRMGWGPSRKAELARQHARRIRIERSKTMNPAPCEQCGRALCERGDYLCKRCRHTRGK